MGSSDFPVAVTDGYFNNANDDLVGQVISVPSGGDPNNHHGLQSFGAIAGLHNDFCIAGVSPDTKVKGYQPASNNTLKNIANDGFKIISVTSYNCSVSRATIEEVVSKGTTVVWSSPGGNNCKVVNGFHDVPGVIIVGRAWADGSHRNNHTDGDENIDVLFGSQLNRLAPVNTCEPSGEGTSIATPHVAGVVNLMLSVNQCLFPADIEEILVETAGVNTNPSVVRGGAVDAYAAVQMAENFTGFDKVWSEDAVVEYETVSGDLTINSGADITLIGTLKTGFQSVITVERGSTLTVSGDIQFGDLSEIRVKRGAKLVIDGGILTTADCSDEWKGIFVEGRTSLPQVTTINIPSSITRNGIVEVKNKSIIENAKTAISTDCRYLGWPTYERFFGGLIQIDDSTFRNNRRAGAFMRYGFEDRSFIKNSTFEEHNVVFSQWANFGVTYENNYFTDYEEHAIYTESGACIVKNGNVFNSNLHSQFNQAAIELQGTGSSEDYTSFIGDPRGKPNYFYGGYHGVHIDGSLPDDKHKIVNNIFAANEYGISIYSMGNFTIDNNDFLSNYIGTVMSTTGSFIEENNLEHANSFSNCAFGVYAWYDNLGYEFTANCFDNTVRTDVTYVDDPIALDQGTQLVAASNNFSSPFKALRTDTGVEVSYHLKTDESNIFYIPQKSLGNDWGGNIYDALENDDADCGSQETPGVITVTPYKYCDPPIDEEQFDAYVTGLTNQIDQIEAEMELLEEKSKDWWVKLLELKKLEFCLNQFIRTQTSLKDCESLNRFLGKYQSLPLSSKSLLVTNLFKSNCCSKIQPLLQDTIGVESQEEVDLILTTQFMYDDACTKKRPTDREIIELERIANTHSLTSAFARNLYYKVTGKHIIAPLPPIDDVDPRSSEERFNKNMTVQVNLGPNPVSHQLNYRLLNLERSCRLTIYDNLGKEVQSYLIDPNATVGTLDLLFNQPGMYHCIIRDVADDRLLHSQALTKY